MLHVLRFFPVRRFRAISVRWKSSSSALEVVSTNQWNVFFSRPVLLQKCWNSKSLLRFPVVLCFLVFGVLSSTVYEWFDWNLQFLIMFLIWKWNFKILQRKLFNNFVNFKGNFDVVKFWIFFSTKVTFEIFVVCVLMKIMNFKVNLYFHSNSSHFKVFPHNFSSVFKVEGSFSKV